MIAVSACFARETRWFRAPAGVSVVRTPMGERAARGLESWSDRHGLPAVLVSTGFAGGVNKDLATGDLVLAETVRIGDEEIRVDARWVDRVRTALSRQGLPVTVGTFASVGAVASAQTKRRSAEAGAVALDMESGPLAEWARRREVPFLALRVVLDPAGMEIPFDGETPVWRSVLRHPWVTVDLARRSRSAGRILGEALRLVIEEIGDEAS